MSLHVYCSYSSLENMLSSQTVFRHTRRSFHCTLRAQPPTFRTLSAMVARSLPDVSTLAPASLTNVDDDTTKVAKDLWASQPCVVVPIRRPGCSAFLTRERVQPGGSLVARGPTELAHRCIGTEWQ